MNKLITLGVLFFVLFILFSFGALAQCDLNIQSTSVSGFILEVSTIDQTLKNCQQSLPFPLSWIFSDEKVVLDVAMQNGGSEIFVFEMENGFLSGLSRGGTGTGYSISIQQCGFETALRNGNNFEVYGQLYRDGDLTFSAVGFWKRILLKTAKPFLGIVLPTPSTSYAIECTDTSAGFVTPTVGGKPDNCDETYLPGHQGYAENKDLWDSYSADTDRVCQSQFGRGAPSPCAHTIQLSISGNPYYLCWYNE